MREEQDLALSWTRDRDDRRDKRGGVDVKQEANTTVDNDIRDGRNLLAETTTGARGHSDVSRPVDNHNDDGGSHDDDDDEHLSPFLLPRQTTMFSRGVLAQMH